MLTRLGPFRLLSRIAKGGMGETFVGERTGATGVVQRVCVKTLLGQELPDPKWIEDFKNEARLVAPMRHPNIVALYDFDQTMGIWWMALELVKGLDVRALISARRASGERLPIEVVVYIAAELAKALSYAHRMRFADTDAIGLIHRDVSPSNILLSTDGAVKLTDFGIAKVQKNVWTQTGHIKGKELYMSPEQAIGDPIDPRSDLFSPGIVLFEPVGYSYTVGCLPLGATSR
ncbi:serine/threonine-protein kinase [Sorangium sp. So ce887]|uniref:serine/threonine-protein kinase n=1 Tax=Sorangium sp. So ce887 TaxID=3133324 RepID=UPI003F63A7AB